MSGVTKIALRAAPVGLGRAHGRADAEAPRLVARGRDDAAAARIAADDDGLAPQLRPVELLHGGEEGVEVEVRDHARRRAHGRDARRHRLAAREHGAHRRRACGSLTVSFARAPLRFSCAAPDALPGGAAALLERRPARPPAPREPVTTTPIGAARGRIGRGRHEAPDAQRGRALHRAHVGELQARRVGARDRQRHAPAAQRGDRHAHRRASVLPAIAVPSDRPPALSATLGRRPAMPRIQTLIVAASLRQPERARAQLERARRRPSSSAPAGRPTARRAAPRTSVMPARDLLALPHAREIDRVLPPHHGVEHEPHRLPGRDPPR